MSAAWVTALSSLGLVVIAILGWCARQLWRAGSRILRFLDDYFGEPARPGVPERPGVMARLAAVEQAAAKAEATAAQVLAETRPNGGHSLRDVVHRTANDVTTIKQDQAAMRARMEQIEHTRQEGHTGG